MHADKDIRLLKQELRRLALVTAGMTGITGIVLALLWEPRSALQWVIVTGLLGSVVGYQTRNRLVMNRAQSSAVLYPTLGLANRLTVLRGGLISATGGFLFLDWPPGVLAWLPGCLYTLAAILDRVDGFVARKRGQTSLLGIELDTLFDALGLAVAPLLAVWYGQIHWSYLLFSIAYYLFQWGIYRRRRKGLPVQNLPPNIVRRTWAGFQMGFIGVVLFPLFMPPLTRVAGIAFVVPVLAGFLIDWLVVSGRIDRGSESTARLCSRCEQYGHRIFHPLLRVLVTTVVIFLTGFPDTAIESAMLITAGLVFAGLSGRAAALMLIVLLGFYYREHAFGVAGMILTFSTVWVMLLGTGHYSLWRPDEDWINRYDGV